MRRAVGAFLVDVAAVLLFASLGRATHADGVTVGGVLLVAWPFVVALALGWGLARTRGSWPVGVAGSPVVWLTMVVLGLALRVATGGGFAWSFAVVTLVVLGVFVVGWRCAREVVRFAVEGLARWSHDRGADRARADRARADHREHSPR